MPIATLTGGGNTSSGGGLNFCQLFGTSTVFSDAKLLSLYPNHTAFVNLWNTSVDSGVSGGFIAGGGRSDAEAVGRGVPHR